MKRYLLLNAVLLAALCGCHRQTICARIPIPATDSRTDKLNLPLSNPDAADLIKHLRFGLSREKEANRAMPDANADQIYSARIELLKKPLTRKSLNSGDLKKWFPYKFHKTSGGPDASTDSGGFAANDGTYFWIFYQTGNKLTQVLVAKVNSCENIAENKR